MFPVIDRRTVQQQAGQQKDLKKLGLTLVNANRIKRTDIQGSQFDIFNAAPLQGRIQRHRRADDVGPLQPGAG